MMWIPPVNLYSVGDTYLPVFTDASDDNFRNFYSIVMYSPEHQTNITVVCKTKFRCLILLIRKKAYLHGSYSLWDTDPSAWQKSDDLMTNSRMATGKMAA